MSSTLILLILTVCRRVSSFSSYLKELSHSSSTRLPLLITNEISTFLLAAILKNKEFKTHCLRYKSGTTVLHLSKRALPEYRLTFPNNLEDIKPLEKILSEIYKTTAKNIEESASLLKLRDTLLPKLMLENSDSSTAKLSFI